MLQAGWDILVAAISPIIERFKGFCDDLAGKGEGLSGVWNTVTTFIGEKVNEIWSVIQTALEAITAIWETHKGWIIPTLTFLWTTIGTIIGVALRSEEHTSELQSLMRISYAVFCLKKKKTQ